MDQLKGKVQIIAFSAKPVPKAYKAITILDQESLAIVVGLFCQNRFVSGVPVTLLTDSRGLAYLLSTKIHNTSANLEDGA
jgi:hypothetical protein